MEKICQKWPTGAGVNRLLKSFVEALGSEVLLMEQRVIDSMRTCFVTKNGAE